MRGVQSYLFVLWGERFEELPATAALTILRHAGLRVKLVGLSRGALPGAHGLALLPDLTLEEALRMAAQTRALFIPCGVPGLPYLLDDPRVPQFLRLAHQQHALLFSTQAVVAKFAELRLLPTLQEEIVAFPPEDKLVSFLHSLGKALK